MADFTTIPGDEVWDVEWCQSGEDCLPSGLCKCKCSLAKWFYCTDDVVQMGYGSRALQALNSFYSGEYFNLDESNKPEPSYPDAAAIDPVS